MVTTVSLAAGCEAPPAELTLSIRQVQPDKVSVLVQTRPGLLVGLQGAPDGRVKVGADGKAVYELAIPSEGRLIGDMERDRVNFEAVADKLFGEQRVGQAVLQAGLRYERIRSIPRGNQAAWTWYIGRMPRNQDPLVSFTRPMLSGQKTEVGTGTVGPDGGQFAGPPGARVRIGATSFVIGPNGIGRYKPTGAELLQTLPGGGTYSQEVPVSVEAAGKTATYTARMKLETLASRAICDHVRSQVKSKRPLAPGGQPGGEQVLICRLDGTPELHRLSSKKVKPGLFNARFVALESERSRRQGKPCTRLGVKYLVKRGGQTIGGRQSKTKITPSLISTSFELVEMTSHKTLGTVDFEAEDGACKKTIYPYAYGLKAWLRKQAAAAKK